MTTAVAGFASLPVAVVWKVFALLPVDARLRCAEVCRAWRHAAAEPSLWRSLDLSPESGGLTRETHRIGDSLLHAACACACGGLQTLNATGCYNVTPCALCAAAAANGGALHALHANLRFVVVEPLFRGGAPALRELGNCETNSVAQARLMLRRESPFEQLCTLRHLTVDKLNALERVRIRRGEIPPDDDDSAHGLAADVAAHASLSSLRLVDVELTDFAPRAPDGSSGLDAVVDAALARGLTSFSIQDKYGLSPAHTPALARLLARSSALTTLGVSNGGQQLLNVPAAAMLSDALRDNATLTHLQLCAVQLWGDAGVATALLAALTGHPRLRTLSLHCNVRVYALRRAERAAVADALGALIAADTPALTYLDLSSNPLADAELRPLADALRLNSHLQMLNIQDTGATPPFLRDVLLPAASTNAALRVFHNVG
jgi:hypothetical protein